MEDVPLCQKDRVAAFPPDEFAMAVALTVIQSNREDKSAGANKCCPSTNSTLSWWHVVCPRGVDKKSLVGNRAIFKVESSIKCLLSITSRHCDESSTKSFLTGVEQLVFHQYPRTDISST